MNGALRAGREALETLWRQGLCGRTLLHKHSRLIDDHLIHCFNNCPAAAKGMSLLALGGYGRSELYPFSDVDILLVYAPETKEYVAEAAEAVFYPLWDAGLEVGHGVRTPRACLADAGKDFFFQVAMLDARLLAGSRSIAKNLEDSFRQSFVEGHRLDFLDNMTLHRRKRHARFGRHGYLLEPDIKESRGGLRDIQTVLWTAQVVFGLHDLNAMENAGLLTGREAGEIEKAWDHLIRIRNRLHYISGRKNDRLFFEHQEEIAHAFGYKKTKDVLGVEHFMQDVYADMQTLATSTDLFLEHIEEVFAPKCADAKEEALEPGLAVRGGRIHITDKGLLQKRPYLLMRVFAQAARHGCPVHNRSRKLITEHLHLIDDRLRRSRRMAKSFLAVLQGPHEPAAALTAMIDSGLLCAYIPEFLRVRSLSQHDIYHAYTVDRHLIQTVAEIDPARAEEGIAASRGTPVVLCLAALLHDIGKGAGQGHAEKGAKLAAAIGRRLNLSDPELSDLVFLVRHHLFLTATALRRDLDDENFIIRCARKIRTPERLDMLYRLSVADARATGPGAWNEWKAALLQELYLKIAHLLEQTELINPERAHGIAWLRSQVHKIVDDNEGIRVEDLPEDYLLNFSPESIAGHLTLSKGIKKGEIILLTENKGNYWSLLIMAYDRPGLLSNICGILALHNLNVLSAQICTWSNGMAVDLVNVKPAFEQSYDEQDWQVLSDDLKLALVNRVGLPHRLASKHDPSKDRPQVPQPSCRVVIDNQISDFFTVIEVFAEDRIGLLYKITRSLTDFAVNIYRAKIEVEGNKAIDVFYVLTDKGEKIIDPSFQQEIHSGLMYAASGKEE